MKIDTLITVLGWEDRFNLGIDIILEKHEIKHLILISFADYDSMTGMKDSKAYIHKLATENNIEIQEVELKYSDSIQNWRLLNTHFENKKFDGEVLINITTFPRETIWTLLFFLKNKLNHINYIYFKPNKYDKTWLTKNHKTPRLLFKHSGVFELDQELILFVITGYDLSRLNSLIDYYEPRKIIVFCQKGKQFDNMTRNNGVIRCNTVEFEKIEFDSYNINEASKILNENIQKHKDSNIIIASQGPKLSALSTYKNYLLSESRIALAYVPARDFNNEYSTGIDPNYISGQLEF